MKQMLKKKKYERPESRVIMLPGRNLLIAGSGEYEGKSNLNPMGGPEEL